MVIKRFLLRLIGYRPLYSSDGTMYTLDGVIKRMRGVTIHGMRRWFPEEKVFHLIIINKCWDIWVGEDIPSQYKLIKTFKL